jgi:glutamyl-Q tRNA(Asp) synthetase
MATLPGPLRALPTGPLHLGSLVTALASWLDARAHGGDWLVRIEDIDYPRCVRDADNDILRTLDALGLHPDEPPVWQAAAKASMRRRCAGSTPPASLSVRLHAQGNRRFARARARAASDARLPGHLPQWPAASCRAPGACACPMARRQRSALTIAGRAANARTWKPNSGDFVLRRADGLWAYQLAVVVDDAAQGITHIVRGADLLDSTPRQIHLQHLLGLPTPTICTCRWWSTRSEEIEQAERRASARCVGAAAMLRTAGTHLGIVNRRTTVAALAATATGQWLERLRAVQDLRGAPPAARPRGAWAPDGHASARRPVVPRSSAPACSCPTARTDARRTDRPTDGTPGDHSARYGGGAASSPRRCRERGELPYARGGDRFFLTRTLAGRVEAFQRAARHAALDQLLDIGQQAVIVARHVDRQRVAAGTGAAVRPMRCT